MRAVYLYNLLIMLFTGKGANHLSRRGVKMNSESFERIQTSVIQILRPVAILTDLALSIPEVMESLSYDIPSYRRRIPLGRGIPLNKVQDSERGKEWALRFVSKDDTF